MRRLRKWWAIFRVAMIDSIAYRASGVIWIMTDVTTAITMPVVWSAAAQGGPVGGFTANSVVAYYMVSLLLSGFITSHFMWEIGTEVREGQFSNYLLRPMSYWEQKFFHSLAWRLFRPVLFLPFFLLFLWLYRHQLSDFRPYLGPEAWISVVAGHMVSVTMGMALAMIALYVEEAMSLFELYYIPLMFLSGSMFPVSVLPEWMQGLARALPFYYTVAVPSEIVMGRHTPSAAWGLIAIQLGFILFFGLLYRVLFRNGVKRYSSVGM